MIINAHQSFVKEMLQYLLQKEGKLLRAILVLLSGGVHTTKNYGRICDAALAIELLHTATLVHDDINDNAKIRRNQQTCHQKYGGNNSILIGDFLFSQSFLILSKLENTQIMRNISQTIATICEGEILQNVYKTNFNISLTNYLNIIRKKTASLIGESCRIGALAGKINENDSELLYQFGLNLGMAFQIYDDYLDFQGDSETLGKEVFTDIKNGYATLPIIYLMERSQDIHKVTDILQNIHHEENIHNIQTLLDNNKCLTDTLNTANKYKNMSLEYLEKLHNKVIKNTLKEITSSIIECEQ